MTGNMHFRNIFMKNLGAAAIEMIDQIGNGLFIPGNKPGGKDHRIAASSLICL